MLAAFTRHPETVGETYVEHMGVAAGFGTRMLMGALACYVHALLPFLFERTASATIAGLHDRMVMSRRRQPALAGRPAREALPGLNGAAS